MAKLCLLLGDQLNLHMSSLSKIDKSKDIILMAEVKEEASYVKHHKIKIAFLFSAMRHFCEDLKTQGFNVYYRKYDDKNNKGSLYEEVKSLVQDKSIEALVVAKPGEYRLYEEIKNWEEQLGIDVQISPDNRFIAKEEEFSNWAKGKKQLRMEYFYREMRKTTGYLMEGKDPCGGKWNFDADNREKFTKDKSLPEPTKFEADNITQDVIALVNSSFKNHFGELSQFHYAVTRDQALRVLEEFISERLKDFGKYQDAMVQDEAWMYHSHVSFYINAGLLHPKEVMDAAQDAYDKGDVPINSVEGFIRQILGWREYVRGFYWHFMPELKKENYLSADLPLPDFYWGADTQMNCISQCVKQTKEHAYAHHIQRLMVLGNFALLAGISPDEMNEWYLIVYGDAYEWVELPNVSSMILFADGGKLASKPYAASGSYINKMSNYCQHCHYNVREKTGPQACPFNYLYWGFINKHKSRFENNPRMAMIYKTMQKMDQENLSTMLDDAEHFIKKLKAGEKV